MSSTRASVKADADDKRVASLKPGEKKGGESSVVKEELCEQGQEGSPDDCKPSPPKSSSNSRKRVKRDTTNDVLYAKGAAAQTMSNPGNLYFYQLCEEHYDEYMKLDPDDQQRKVIALSIVDKIIAKGGKFHSPSGAALTKKAAVGKTQDRMRQISKPKLRPSGFGEHDVVSARGAAIHLYPGNAKWHAVVDGYVLSYYRDEIDKNGMYDLAKEAQLNKNKKKFVKKGEKVKPTYQDDIVEEIISIIHKRGGKFCNERLKEMSHKEVVAKMHNRFKDLKKALKNCKTFAPHTDDAIAAMKKEGGGADLSSADDTKVKTESGTEIMRNRSGGFSSVKNTVSSVYEMRAYKQKRSRENRKRPKGMKYETFEVEDDGSYNSDMLVDESEDEGEEEDSDDNLAVEDYDSEDNNMADDYIKKKAEKKAERALKRKIKKAAEEYDSDDSMAAEYAKEKAERAAKRKQAANNREARAKRRRSGIPLPPLPTPVKKKKKVAKKKKEEEAEKVPEPPLSEYELKRLEKIQRNKERLASLGLGDKNRPK